MYMYLFLSLQNRLSGTGNCPRGAITYNDTSVCLLKELSILQPRLRSGGGGGEGSFSIYDKLLINGGGTMYLRVQCT